MPSRAPRSWLETAALVTRSAARRYPRELLDALRDTPNTLEVLPLLHLDGSAFLANTTPDNTTPATLAAASLAAASLAASWLGHATTLLKLGDKWILTDPVLSPRIGVSIAGRVMGLARRLPLIDLATLPPIDVILLSHAHFDHLDTPTLNALARRQTIYDARPHTHIITAPGTANLIPKGFAAVHELAWDARLQIGPLIITAIKPRHWGARTLLDHARGFNAYLIQGDGPSIFFAGDTALTDSFRGLDASLSIFGIGAYDPWQDVHATPEQAFAMHETIGAKYLLPVHHRTFRLSDEPDEEPMQRLLSAAAAQVATNENTSPSPTFSPTLIIPDTLARLWVPANI